MCLRAQRREHPTVHTRSTLWATPSLLLHLFFFLVVFFRSAADRPCLPVALFFSSLGCTPVDACHRGRSRYCRRTIFASRERSRNLGEGTVIYRLGLHALGTRHFWLTVCACWLCPCGPALLGANIIAFAALDAHVSFFSSSLSTAARAEPI